MKFIKSTVYILLSVIIFLIAIFLILGGFMAIDEQFTAMVIHLITQIKLPGLFIFAGVVFFLLSLVLYAVAGRGSAGPASFNFEGESGPITISLRAIEDYITKYLEEQRIVGNVKTKVGVSKDGKSLVIRAGISAWSEQNLKDVGEKIQREISSRLKEGLGLNDLDHVVVSVDKIITSRSSRRPLPQPPADSL